LRRRAVAVLRLGVVDARLTLSGTACDGDCG
jgi:hypothetical protein